MNIGRLFINRQDRCVAFRINHEDLHRTALLSAEETRGLIGHLQRLVAEIETVPEAVDLLSDLLA